VLEPLIAFCALSGPSLALIGSAVCVVVGVYVLISSLDDLAIDAFWLWTRMRRRGSLAGPAGFPGERRIAIFIPLWDEAAVIGRMLDHNLAAIDYGCYEVFVGVYPNDPGTLREVRLLELRRARVHAAEVPHKGPTSKADCLNWIYQRMLLWEEAHSVNFDLVLIHDAEDLIHPASLRKINSLASDYDMIQVPVLALPSPFNQLTHGVYCDEFAESQWKDLPARVSLGGFLPGCGVGTGFRREALDLLAKTGSNRIFQPDALTEDYDIGLRMFQLGFRQTVVPLEFREGVPLATREYFPSRARAAARQRTRWVTGNALQCWQKYGWGSHLRKSWIQVWFFWKDRKGVWGSPLSLLGNVLLACDCFSRLWTGDRLLLTGGLLESRWGHWLLTANMLLLLEKILLRCCASARIYGWAFSLGVPLRMLWGNGINAWASLRAVWNWARSRITGFPLRWMKTEHAYPTRSALATHKRKLEEVLVSGGWCTREKLDLARASLPEGRSLDRHLVETGMLSEEELYAAISAQQAVPHTWIEPQSVPLRIARTLPSRVADEWTVLPFRIADGALELASPRVPDDEMHGAIQRYTKLSLTFHLVTPSHFSELKRRLL